MKATVKRLTRNCRHLVAGRDVTDAVCDLEIIAEDAGFLLLRFDQSGVCIADTWHESEAQAKSQAKFEYEVEPEDWKL